MIEAMETLRSEVTGTVWKIQASPGATVAEGDPVVIVESMKMEIPVCATRGGVVQQVLVAEGERVTEEQPVAILA